MPIYINSANHKDAAGDFGRAVWTPAWNSQGSINPARLLFVESAVVWEAYAGHAIISNWTVNFGRRDLLNSIWNQISNE